MLAVVSDRIIPILGDGVKTTSFEANVVAANDYYPFGMYMPGRTKESDEYRYGFQGQELDNETGLVNYKFRMHDARLGRFFAVDPLTSKYPFNSPYAFSENSLIGFVELEGLEKTQATTPPSRTTSAFKVYNWLQVGASYYVTYDVYNATPASAQNAQTSNALNNGLGRKVGEGEFNNATRSGGATSWNYLSKNPVFRSNTETINDAAPLLSLDGTVPAPPAVTQAFNYVTDPAVLPLVTSPTANVVTTTTTTLTLNYDFNAAPDNLTVTDGAGNILSNNFVAGAGPIVVDISALGTSGTLNITITPGAGSNIGSVTATVSTTSTRTVTDPNAGTDVGPAVPNIVVAP